MTEAATANASLIARNLPEGSLAQSRQKEKTKAVQMEEATWHLTTDIAASRDLMWLNTGVALRPARGRRGVYLYKVLQYFIVGRTGRVQRPQQLQTVDVAADAAAAAAPRHHGTHEGYGRQRGQLRVAKEIR
jgi:hypothetical protein